MHETEILKAFAPLSDIVLFESSISKVNEWKSKLWTTHPQDDLVNSRDSNLLEEAL